MNVKRVQDLLNKIAYYSKPCKFDGEYLDKDQLCAELSTIYYEAVDEFLIEWRRLYDKYFSNYKDTKISRNYGFGSCYVIDVELRDADEGDIVLEEDLTYWDAGYECKRYSTKLLLNPTKYAQERFIKVVEEQKQSISQEILRYETRLENCQSELQILKQVKI